MAKFTSGKKGKCLQSFKNKCNPRKENSAKWLLILRPYTDLKVRTTLCCMINNKHSKALLSSFNGQKRRDLPTNTNVRTIVWSKEYGTTGVQHNKQRQTGESTLGIFLIQERPHLTILYTYKLKCSLWMV